MFFLRDRSVRDLLGAWLIVTVMEVGGWSMFGRKLRVELWWLAMAMCGGVA